MSQFADAYAPASKRTSSCSDGDSATEQTADRGWIAATGSPVPHDSKPIAGQAVHDGLGAALGIGYSIAAEFEPRVAAGAGTLFATGSWAVLDQAAVPAAVLSTPPWKASVNEQAFGLASHVVQAVPCAGRKFHSYIKSFASNERSV